MPQRVKNSVDSNPYHQFVAPESATYSCVVCDRVIQKADWTAHTRGKKHKEAELTYDAAKKAETQTNEARKENGKPDYIDVDGWGNNAKNTGLVEDGAPLDADGWTNTAVNPGHANKGAGGCHTCGQSGHFARDCSNKNVVANGACRKCGDQGHFAKDCPQPRESSSFSGSCYNCGQEGHSAKNCSEPRQERAGRGSSFSGSCYNCGEQGHSARNCSEPRQERAGGGGGGSSFSGSCYNCGEQGHSAKNCSGPHQERARGSRVCYNCNQPGHVARDCLEEAGSAGSAVKNADGGFNDDWDESGHKGGAADAKAVADDW